MLSDGGLSHALVKQPSTDEPATVTQRGPRNLWDEAEETYLRWVAWGEPGQERFGLTVDADGQHVWLDSPRNQVRRGMGDGVSTVKK